MAAIEEVTGQTKVYLTTALREQFRTFHLTGEGLDEAKPAGGLRPTLLASLAGLTDLEACYPVCVQADGSVKVIQAFKDVDPGDQCPNLK